MRESKRGVEGKYWLIASLILGIVVVSILIFFMFNAYFTSEDINFQTCRESILLRANSPELNKFGVNLLPLKDKFPLKCKTEVVTVTKKDVEDKKVGKVIGDTFAQCWALFDNGEIKAFPSKSLEIETFCMPCARIHFTDEARDALEGRVPIWNLLETTKFKGVSYKNYLNGVNKKDIPFHFMRPFSISDTFFVDSDDFEKFTAGSAAWIPDFISTESLIGYWGVSKVSLPRTLDLQYGDLIITYGIQTNGDWYDSYMFYYQANRPGSAAQTNKMLIGSKLKLIDTNDPVGDSASLCDQWDGVPA